MKITDETKTFESKHRFGTDNLTLTVSSNHYGEHEKPSVYLKVYNPFSGEEVSFGTKDTEQIKEIIEHMAKMAGLSVTFEERFDPQYQPGDRVRSLTEDSHGQLGTVILDSEHPVGWNVQVQYDDDTDGGGLVGLFMYSELEPVTKSSS